MADEGWGGEGERGEWGEWGREGEEGERDGGNGVQCEGLLRHKNVTRNVTLHGIFEYQQGGEEQDLLFNMCLH